MTPSLHIRALNVGAEQDFGAFCAQLGERTAATITTSCVPILSEDTTQDVLLLRTRTSGPTTSVLLGYLVGRSVSFGTPVIVLSDYVKPDAIDVFNLGLGSVAWSTIAQAEDSRFPALCQFFLEVASARTPREGDREFSAVERLHQTFREQAVLLHRLDR